MAEQRDQLVRRVVHALEERRDPAGIVHAYFDADRRVVVEAARQTFEATREDLDPERVAAVVDRELIEGLRLPERVSDGLLPTLIMNRHVVAGATVLTTIGAALAVFLL